MEARATLRGTELAGGVLRTLIVAILIALLVGGAGGYIVRGLTSAAAVSPTDVHRPFVVEQPPYQPTASQEQCRWTGTPPQLSC